MKVFSVISEVKWLAVLIMEWYLCIFDSGYLDIKSFDLIL